MFKFLKKTHPSEGTVGFRGNLAPRPEEFEFLQQHGIKLKRADPKPGEQWRLGLSHPQWGKGVMAVVRDRPVLVAGAAQWGGGPDSHVAAAAGCEVSIAIEARHGDVLHDRKNLLRYMRAILGSDGVAALDRNSGMVWTADALDDELQHNAALWISSLFIGHLVTASTDDPSKDPPEDDDAPRNVKWAHSHGLDTLGVVDFDILRPSPDLVDSFSDISDALAFGLLDGDFGPGDSIEIVMGAPFKLVRVEEFSKLASADDRAMRDDDEFHNSNRVICCDTGDSGLRSVFGGKRPVACRALSKFKGDGSAVLQSPKATALMAQRARNTYDIFRQAYEEFADVTLGALIKCGYDDRTGNEEHLWFNVESLHDNGAHAILANEPFNIPSMKAGDRSFQPLDRLTDWAIGTPGGTINPNNLHIIRALRNNPEARGVMRQLIAEHGKAGTPNA